MAKAFSMTDIGRKRKMNQDYVFASDGPVGRLPNLYIVADGMGGHRAGDYASRFSVEEMVREVSHSKGRTKREIIDLALHGVNRLLYLTSTTLPAYQGCGTTIVVCTMEDNMLQVANVGDSRLYLIDSDIRQITVDHSLVEEMILAGTLDEKSARTHPDRNIITRAVGAESYIDVDFFSCDLHRGDLVLMCTDGLTNMLENWEILQIIKKRGNDLGQATEELVRAANAAGGHDNISVMLIDPFAKD